MAGAGRAGPAHRAVASGRELLVSGAPVLAVDIGGTKLAAGLVDPAGRLSTIGVLAVVGAVGAAGYAWLVRRWSPVHA